GRLRCDQDRISRRVDDLRDAADGRRHEGTTRRHRLEDDDPERLVPGWHDDDVRRLIEGTDGIVDDPERLVPGWHDDDVRRLIEGTDGIVADRPAERHLLAFESVRGDS